MKKWMTTIPPSMSKPIDRSDDFYYKHQSFSPYIKIDEYTNMDKSRPPAKLPDEDALYDNLEHYHPSPATSNDSQNGYVASSSSVLSGEDSFYDNPYAENGMFSGPVTDLDEDSDPEEIKMYNPATKTISIRKPRVKHNVQVQINVQLQHLEQDIQRMIDEMASLEGSVRSDSSKADSGIHEIQQDENRIEEDTGERRIPTSGLYAMKNRKMYWNGSKKWSVTRNKDTKDVKNITCLVNENFDESQVFKSSVTGVPLGMSETALSPYNHGTDWRNGVQRYQRRHPVVVPKRRHEGSRAFCCVAALGISVALASMAYHAVADVQTTLRTDLNFGLASLMTVQASKFVTAMFVPALVPKYLGRKWTCFAGALLGVAWPALQLLPPARSELFAAVAVGAAAQGLAEVLLLGAALPLVCEVAVARGAHAVVGALAALAAAGAIGHAAAGAMDAAVLMEGWTWVDALEVPNNCLLNHCVPPPVRNQWALWGQLNSTLWLPLLAVPFLAAFVVAVAVRPPSNAERRLDLGGPNSRNGVMRRLFDCRLFLLVPAAAMSGFMDAFFMADLPKEMSACAWGGARATLGPAVAAVAHAAVAAFLAPAAARPAAARLSFATACALLAASGGAVATTDWAAKSPVRLLLPVALAGAGAAFDVGTAATAAFAFPDRHTLAFSVLLAARAAGCLLFLGVSPLLCLYAKLILLAAALLLALASTAALELLRWRDASTPLADAVEAELRRRDSPPAAAKGRRSFGDGMVEVPLDRDTNY